MTRSAFIKSLTIIICFLFAEIGRAQHSFKKREDSLRVLISKTEGEEKRKKIILLIDPTVHGSDSIHFFRLFSEFVRLSKSEGDDSLLASLYHQAGIHQYYRRNYILAADYLDTAIMIERRSSLQSQMMKSFMTRGAVYYTGHNYYKALSDYLVSEKLMQDLKSPSIGGLYSNIAMIYSEMNDLDLAESYNNKAIPFIKKAKDVEGLAKVYNNLGLLQKNRANFKAADSLFSVGLLYARKNHLDRDLQDVLFNQSGVKMHMNRPEEALVLRLELLELVKKNYDANWLKVILLDIGETYSRLGNRQKAKEYMKQAEAIQWNEAALPEMTDYYSTIGSLQQEIGDFKNAAASFSRACAIQAEEKRSQDLMNLEKLRYNNQRQQDSLAFVKQQEIDKLHSEKIQQETEHRLSRQKIITSIIIAVLLVIGFFSVTLFRANRQKEAANTELKEQKRLVSEKNTEITDSIQYSLRIQESLLPSQRKLSHYLPQHFLIYLPKDIVSGDFYWLQDIGNNEILLAVADCTGHGVPGAIISALSIQQLNGISRTVKEPGKILQRLNKKLKENLKQEDEGISKDGLDICLCRISFSSKKIIYAGANRNLWIFGKDGLKQEVKATKAGIAGHTSSEQEYAQHEIVAEETDYFVMSSDGFADQFGGNRQKKITTKYFKNWIVSGPPDFDKKGDDLKQKFMSWKQNQEQIDDVCVMAFSPFSPAKT